MHPSPSTGRIVHYRLSAEDLTRVHEYANRPTHNPPVEFAEHRVGDVLPAIVVRAEGNTVNLHVFLDGPGTLWLPNREHGHEPGHWHWPPIAPATAAARH
ncbi:hypothetical protein [Streptomyces sp. NRRL S-350]|uniref:hypothetical protein n=1 Tax=Streptomyces sp. NRRL S-350 TaxID=1463902 RepID=UPI0004BFA4CC|nr:hypothetical protein [Streptomyces sp. NRRL S-350]